MKKKFHDNSSSEEGVEELKQKYNNALDRINIYQAKANSAEVALQGCKSSASYKLGHLLIHETKTFKDVLKLFSKIKSIRNNARYPTKKLTEGTNKEPLSTGKKYSISAASSKNSEKEHKQGISIILPTYKGQHTILRALNSLAKQDMPNELYEIIIIINGEKDNTEKLINEFYRENRNLNIHIISLKESGASLARNKGIEKASHEYILFIDDDDSVSSTYLSAMYDLAAKDTIVLSQIINIDEDMIDSSNAINMQILKTDTAKDNLYIKCPSVLTINACKLIPTSYIRQIKFDTELKSGEDVVYFSELFSRFSFKFKIAKEAIYFRFVKHNSVSRQPLSFQFNVLDRLLVISKVFDSLTNSSERYIQDFLKQKISAQITFINAYLKEFPDEYERVVDTIKKSELHAFPYDKLQKKNRAKDLIISYCFTPYVDTSAIVMAKRIREQDKIVDVVYNNMHSVRIKDERLNSLADELIDTRLAIDTTTNFSDWNSVEFFSTAMMKKIKQLNKDPYESIYSRVMWPASNFAAFEYKLQNPKSIWIAEFSDPILFDIHGKERYSKLDTRWHYKEIQKLLQNQNLTIPQNDNLFFWCEYLAFVFADKLIFTNENQLSYMVEKSELSLHELIRKKAIIKEHPTLSKKYYHTIESNYSLNLNKVNLAYFGTFYHTRKLNDIVEAIKILPKEYKEKVLIHIFTNTKDELKNLIHEEKLDDNFEVNDYVNFFEFLNLTTKFDCLILNDAITKPEKSINPYLPSKLSDYKGSSKSIWGLYEEGSILSKYDGIRYKSKLGNITQSCEVLENIIDDHCKEIA